MAAVNVVQKQIWFPRELVARANAMRVPFGKKFTHLVIEGLELRVTQLEEQMKATFERREAIKEHKRKAKTGKPKSVRGALPDVSSILGKKLPFVQSLSADGDDDDLFPGNKPVVDPVTKTADDELYERAARTLLGVTDVDEAKRRAQAAVNIVKSERRLTAPSEEEILARIEENFRRVKGEAQPTTRTLANLVDTIIDVDKVKTVEPSE